MLKKRIAGRLSLRDKACPKPPPKKLGTIIKDALFMRDLKRGAFFYFWLLINLFVANELIAKPLFIAQTIASLATFTTDQIVRVTCPLDRPSYFESNIILVNFTLFGNPKGYRIRAHADFIFLCNSKDAKGFCRINVTALCNGKESFRIVRDEEIISFGGSSGTIEIPINEGEENARLMVKNNTLILLITIMSALHYYEEGFAEIKVGPVNLIFESFDVDVDGIPDPVDNLEGNNQALFLTSFTLPLILVIADEKFKLRFKSGRKI
ncbi:MAG: hypothetical protein QXU95_06050 [Candidatus Bathyarchaeia archaeon]|nr:hypothetical protein [Candidatus Bathyarchaeota archaeon]